TNRSCRVLQLKSAPRFANHTPVHPVLKRDLECGRLAAAPNTVKENEMTDLKEALRRLRKTPGFTITAVLTLALGIGATTAIFTLVHQVMLKSLPVTKPEELWRVGDKVRCCNWVGSTQDNDANCSIVSYEH